MDSLLTGLDAEVIKRLIGEAASADFLRMCAMFSLAAFIHARQVRKEIRDQLGVLITVLREDLDATKSMLGTLHTRVDRIENILNQK